MNRRITENIETKGSYKLGFFAKRKTQQMINPIADVQVVMKELDVLSLLAFFSASRCRMHLILSR